MIRHSSDRGEDGVKHDIHALTTSDVVDAVPDTSGKGTGEDGPIRAVNAERETTQDGKVDLTRQ